MIAVLNIAGNAGRNRWMQGQFIFGYGSLVNGATHDYGQVHAATLNGWRRVWHYTSLRDIAYLSAEAAPGSSIRGVVLQVPEADAALEDREREYARTDVSGDVRHDIGQKVAIDVFGIPPLIRRAKGANSTLLLSYVDVVVQGYLNEFGKAGVQQFFETTGGWGARIIDDRAAPVYPRHQVLSGSETELTDHWLNRLSAEME